MPVSGFDPIADFYDADIGAERDASGDSDFYREVCRSAAQVLELGAGTGRIAIALAQAGCRVTAVDASSPMLGVLDRKLRSLRLHSRVTTMLASMQDYRPTPGLDRVLVPFRTLNHLPDAESMGSVLQRASTALRPGGALALDMLIQGPWMEHVQGRRTERVFEHRGKRYSRSTTITVVASDSVRIDLCYRDQGGLGAELGRVSMHNHVPSLAQVREVLEQASFRPTLLASDFRATPIDPAIGGALILSAAPIEATPT